MSFWRKVEFAFLEYEFCFWDEEWSSGKRLVYFDVCSALSFLEHIYQFGSKDIGFYRGLLAENDRGRVSDLRDSAVLGELAKRLVTESIILVEREIILPGGIKPGVWETAKSVVKPPKEPEEVVQEAPADSWVSFKIVDDATGMAAAGVKLNIKLPEGYQSEYPGGLTGKIDIRAIVGGQCEVGCDLKDVYIGDCYCFVGEGESRVEEDQEPEYQGKTEMKDEYKLTRGSRIIEVEEYKVKDGETIDSVAEDHGFTWQQLAYFNFGVKKIEDVNRMLYYNIGCSKKTKDGKTFEFESNNDPGILYIPKKWSGLNLNSGNEHFIRVKKISALLPIKYHIDLDDPKNRDDEFILETVDGGWKHTISMKDLEEIEEDRVQLIFPKPPEGKKLNLIHDTKDQEEAYYVFKDIDIKELLPLEQYIANDQEQQQQTDQDEIPKGAILEGEETRNVKKVDNSNSVTLKIIIPEGPLKDGWEDPNKAAEAFYRYYEEAYQKTTRKDELLGLLARSKDSGRYYVTNAVMVPSTFKVGIKIKGNWKMEGILHTHPADSTSDQGFSEDDCHFLEKHHKKVPRYFVRLPGGDVRWMDIKICARTKDDFGVAGISIFSSKKDRLPKHHNF